MVSSRRSLVPILRRFLGVLTVVLAIVLTVSVQTAGSQDACGEYSFGFVGTRLINDGISDSAGPFPISLPAGTYDITMVSHDNHPTADYQPEQTMEQWYFTLSNGYVSPYTDDIPADGENVTTTVAAVAIDEANSIAVHHRGEGGVNSVNVICVGFTPVTVTPAAETTTTTTIATTTTATTTTTTTTEAPEVVVSPPTTAPDTTIATEVLGQVEVAPQLALTGSGETTTQLTILGIVMIGAGLVLTFSGRRREA